MKSKLSRMALAGSVLLAALSAHAEEDKYITDQNGCRIVNPFPRAEETVTWTGGCKDGLVDGKGVLQWYQAGIADEKYEGEMRRGYAEGTGTQSQTDGGRYEGEWKESRQEGEGTYFAADGSIYKGGWKNGKPHGHGTYRTPEGRVMRGQWVDGEYQNDQQDADPNKT